MSKRKNMILPAALATTLALGAAPIAVSAEVDLNTLEEMFPATAEWTEDEWNIYLGENYGTELTDYDSNDELFNELGEPVDINAWISDGSDANVIEAMERYGVTADELATILDNYDSLENIHFVGDLENIFENEGFVEVDAPAVEEEAADDGEAVEENTGDEQAAGNGVTTEDTSEAAEQAEGIDMAMVESVYLTPYGWTEEDFNAYLNDNYNMELADFNDFGELEATVGPLLTDENVSTLLYEYDMTEEDYNTFLEENGYTDEDFVFVADLESALEEAGNTPVNVVDGEEMPDTATNSVQNMLIGTVIALMGAGAFLAARRREGEQ